MYEWVLGRKINGGSNSELFECAYKNVECVAKLPKVQERYISFHLQVDAMVSLAKTSDPNFLVPKVLYYGMDNPLYGEILIIEKMNDIFPVDFMLRTGMVERRLMIIRIAQAIAALHRLSISGYDVEFYWSPEKNCLVLLDIGPRFTINVTTEQMLHMHFEAERSNRAGIWNIVAAIAARETAIELYETNSFMSVAEDILLNTLDEQSVQRHIEDIAGNHYVQLIGSLAEVDKEEAVRVFIRIYKQSCGKSLTIQMMEYLSAFIHAHKTKKSSSTAKLYYSKSNTLSEMSNHVEQK